MTAQGPELAHWRDFPIDADPRPVVLLDDRVQVGLGFVDGDAKVGWLAGAIRAEVDLPAGLLAGLPSRASAADEPPTWLRITGVEPTTATFECDRGPRELPAYRLEVTGMLEPCVVLDPEVEVYWPDPSDDDADGSFGQLAELDADARTLHLPAGGSVLTEFLHAEFQEYPTCVVGRAVTREREQRPNTAIPMVRRLSLVAGRLRDPLGNRVLLDERGTPLAVVPSGS